VRAYVHWHLHNKHKRSMYKPAPYLTHQSSPYQLELLRITIHIIPSHLHYAFRNPRAAYQDRVCPYCLASSTRIPGDEIYIICQCPTTTVVLDRCTVKFQRLTRLIDLPSLTSFSAEETTRLVLGNPPPQILQNDLRRWIQEATPLCCEFAYALRTHITSFSQLLLTCRLMVRTQHRQTITTIFHSSSPPLASNLYPDHQPTPCSHSSTPQVNNSLGILSSSNGPRMAGALATYPKGIVTRNARFVSR